MNQIIRVFGTAIRKKPFVFSAITSSTLLVVADTITEIQQQQQQKPTSTYRLSTPRIMFLVVYSSMITAPFNYYWNVHLERLFSQRLVKYFFSKRPRFLTAASKTLLDQAIAAPLFTISFLLSRGILDGVNFQEIQNRISKDFLKLYSAGLTFWPTIQFANMAIIPAHFRLIFKSFAGFAWNLFTCQIAARERQNVCLHDLQEENQEKDQEPIKESKKMSKKLTQPHFLKNRENSIEVLVGTVRDLSVGRKQVKSQNKQEELEDPKKSGPFSQLVEILVLFLFGQAQ